MQNATMTDPKHPNGHKSKEPTMLDLVDALNEMRDALVNVSTLLREYQFEMDSSQRRYANELATELMQKIKALGQPKTDR